MFGIGMPEMILILIVALIVVGPRKLPELAKSMGSAIKEFKKATSGFKESIKIDEEIDELKKDYEDLDNYNAVNLKNKSKDHKKKDN